MLFWKLKSIHSHLLHTSFLSSSLLEIFAQLESQPKSGASTKVLQKQLRDIKQWQEGHRDAHEMLTELRQLIPVLATGFTFSVKSIILHNRKLVSQATVNLSQEIVLPIGPSVQHSLACFFEEEVEYKVKGENKVFRTLYRFVL